MAQRKEVDMIHGSLVWKIILFALPIAASGLLQQLFNAADTAVVGRFAGSDSLAAVGGNSFIIGLMVNLFLGLSIGSNVLMASCNGQGDREGMVKTLHTSLVFSLICGVFLAVFGQAIAGPAHSLLGTGEAGSALRGQAVLYFRIYFLGMPFIMLYNFEAAILRSKGDTRRPLVVLIISGVLNVLLNLLFVVVFRRAADGVAIATVLANVFNAAALFFLLRRESGAYRFDRRQLRLDGRTLGRILRIGLPAGIQASMFNIANVLLQSAINALGATVIAGTTVGLNAEFFSFNMANGFNQAATTFVGQNFGAGKLRRCYRITLMCVALGAAGTLLVNGLMALFREGFAAIFTADPLVARVACVRIVQVGLFQAINAVGEIFSGGMRGMKRSLVPALISIIAICGVRLLWLFAFYPAHKTYEYLIVAYPLSWAASMTAMTAAYFLTFRAVSREAAAGALSST